MNQSLDIGNHGLCNCFPKIWFVFIIKVIVKTNVLYLAQKFVLVCSLPQNGMELLMINIKD